MPGDSLVLLHGLLGSLDYFGPQARLKSFRVLCPDMIGYGRSSGAEARQEISLGAQAENVAASLRAAAAAPSWILGHSVGGAIAMLVAARAPELVKGVINVEGNFTLDDAFWCRKIAALREEDWKAEFSVLRGDPEKWLRGAGVEPSAERAAWAAGMLEYQPAETVQAVAKAVVAETGDARFLVEIKRVVDSGIPLVLLAGERSAGGWHPPRWAVEGAVAREMQKGAGHMMMLEDPGLFCRIVEEAISRAARRGRG